jgi:hypothetical protein
MEESMIEYTDSLTGIETGMLEGLFVGWKKPHTPERHLEIRGDGHEKVSEEPGGSES